jgi:hypothetical protein
MRNRFTGAMVAATIAAAAAVVSLSVMPIAGQAPAAQGRGRATTAPAAPAAAQPARGGAAVARPARIGTAPNINGIYQAINSANWNLEDHPAADLKQFWQLGAIAAMPAGMTVIGGDGKIPYKPEGLKTREANRKGWPKTDPEAKCYMPGIPRANYMPYPFQIVQGNKDILFVYEFASSNRIVHMGKPTQSPVDSWMGWANGKWDGNTLVIDNDGFNENSWFDRAGNHHSNQLKVQERFTPRGESGVAAVGNPTSLWYEATMTDPETFTRPWKISMYLYRKLEPNAQLLEFKCVEFSEELLYGDLKKKTE